MEAPNLPAPAGPGASRALAWWLTIGGVVGLLASATLLLERLELLANPEHRPSCTVDAVLNCGPVMLSDAAALFGFPNPILGVAAFPVVVTTGVVLLAGARLPRWYWAGLQVGVTLALVFIVWLAEQSIVEIKALCLYCMAVWSVVWPTFWFTTLRNLAAGVFGARAARAGWMRGLQAWAAPVLLAGYLVALAALTVGFWDHWSSLV